MNWYFVGVDLGQSRDFTAIAVVERAEKTGAWDPVGYAWRKVVALELRYLERMALGTPYPEVVERVAQVTRSGELDGRCHLAVDGTGVGRPVVDLLRRARPNCVLLPAMITSGDRETQGRGLLPGSEARPDRTVTGTVAVRGAADRGGVGARRRRWWRRCGRCG